LNHLAQNKDEWREINLQVPKKCWLFLDLLSNYYLIKEDCFMELVKIAHENICRMHIIGLKWVSGLLPIFFSLAVKYGMWETKRIISDWKWTKPVTYRYAWMKLIYVIKKQRFW
jgi:hypothetical protein